MKSRICETPGIVLRRYPFRETSLIVTLFTQDYGKVRGLAKGIRRDAKRFGSSLDLFTLNDILFYRNPQRDLDLISQAVLAGHFPRLRNHLERFAAAGYVLDLIDATTVDHDIDAALFRLLVDVLGALEVVRDPDWLVRLFEVKLLQRIGLMPSLESCNNCRASLEDDRVVFRLEERGILCPKCERTQGSANRAAQGAEGSYGSYGYRLVSGGLVLHRGALKMLSRLSKTAGHDESMDTVTVQVRREVAMFLRRVIDFHVGRRLRSMDFVQKAHL